jgi:RecJ-like exonuclease
MKYKKLNDSIKTFVNKFNEVKNKKLKIISHLDADGISSASILKSAFERENLNFSISIIKQLDKKFLEELKNENSEVLIFTDLASSSISLISNLPQEVFVLDHHILEENYELFLDKITIVNSLIYDLDPNEICGSGLTYLFAKELNEKNKDLAHLAIIGAIGDIQEENGNFKGLNLEILKDAISTRKLKKEKSLRLFGANTRPLHKALEYSTDLHIPGITGSEPNAKLLIEKLNLKNGNNSKKLIELSEEELKKLASEIIVRRIGAHEKPENVFGNIYVLTEEDKNSPLREAHEFSTFLNACGRLNESSIGIESCLGNPDIKEKAAEILINYKKELVNALNWFHKNRNNSLIKEEEKYIIVNAKDNIKDTIIGPFSSILSKSPIFGRELIFLSLAYSEEDKIKISIRTSNPEINVKELLEDITSKFTKKQETEVGGHKVAAGAQISKSMEEELIKNSVETLNKI